VLDQEGLNYSQDRRQLSSPSVDEENDFFQNFEGKEEGEYYPIYPRYVSPRIPMRGLVLTAGTQAKLLYGIVCRGSLGSFVHTTSHDLM
jgi:hypothetical protein